MGKIEDGKWIYHLTKLKNLDSILHYGLLSRKKLNENGIVYEDVADNEIIVKRTGFGLEDYIPFHFHPHTSFDSAVRNKFCDEEFMYLCVQRVYAQKKNFLILPKHPLSQSEVELYSYDEGIALIDWETMEKRKGEEGYDRQVRMAECLGREIITIDCINSIAVRTEAIRENVERKLKFLKSKVPYVNVQHWF